jgi:5-aminopentanamidase
MIGRLEDSFGSLRGWEYGVSMRITVLELPAAFDAAPAQLAKADALLSAGPRSDIVLLPECSLTGYVSPSGDYDLTRFAEPLDGPTSRALADLAIKHSTHLVGPLVESGAYNSMVGFTPTGERFLHYRKRHPWFPEKWAKAGAEPPPLVRIRDRPLTIVTCFDIHFLDDEDVLDEAEVLLFPSAWVEEEDSRPEMIHGIARRHAVVVANANWGVGKPPVKGQGGSMIVDAEGRTLTRATDGRADATI